MAIVHNHTVLSTVTSHLLSSTSDRVNDRAYSRQKQKQRAHPKKRTDRLEEVVDTDSIRLAGGTAALVIRRRTV
ncbi:unnamed protein product, partial [Iphiclides podalirius]